MILGMIPTRERTTAPKVAKMLLDAGCDQVLVASCGCPDFDWGGGNVKEYVLPLNENSTVAVNRNVLREQGLKSGADWFVWADDDVSFKPESVKAMLDVLWSVPCIGAATSWTPVQEWFNEGKKSNTSWLAVSAPCQFYVLRGAAMRELGEYRFPPMEDADWGLRAWEAGWAVAHPFAAHHKANQPRKGARKRGGISETWLREHNRQAAKDVFAAHPELIRRAVIPKQGEIRFGFYYNWADFPKAVKERWGALGYQDKRMEW